MAKPRVFTFQRPEGSGWDQRRALTEGDSLLGVWHGSDEYIVRAIYDWTQTDWLNHLLPEDEAGYDWASGVDPREIAVPDGSIIIVLNNFGRSHAVIYLLEAWPVLITGSLPDDQELHRFKELA